MVDPIQNEVQVVEIGPSDHHQVVQCYLLQKLPTDQSESGCQFQILAPGDSIVYKLPGQRLH